MTTAEPIKQTPVMYTLVDTVSYKHATEAERQGDSYVTQLGVQ